MSSSASTLGSPFGPFGDSLDPAHDADERGASLTGSGGPGNAISTGGGKCGATGLVAVGVDAVVEVAFAAT